MRRLLLQRAPPPARGPRARRTWISLGAKTDRSYTFATASPAFFSRDASTPRDERTGARVSDSDADADADELCQSPSASRSARSESVVSFAASK